MAMGKRQQRQEALFVTTEGLAQSPGHPFYRRLNELLAEAQFDRWIERRCQQYYNHEEKRGQPSVPPGVYFRMACFTHVAICASSSWSPSWMSIQRASLLVPPGGTGRSDVPRKKVTLT